MIHSFIFRDGKLVGRDLALEALRLVQGDKGLVLWVDLENPTPAEIKDILENLFHFHPLAIEDCITPSSLPKIEDYDGYLFMVTHAVDFTKQNKFATTELDLFLGREFLVTFHRDPLKSVQTALDRVGKSTARGPDRLAHTVLDHLVDNYQPVMDELRAELEELEGSVLAEASSQQKLVNELLAVRSDFSRLRHIVRPQRDVIDRLARGDSKFIRASLLPYYRNLRDNLARLEDMANSYHERLMMAFDIYLNKAAFEANEGIKFLTALTAVTLPAVLIGGWYGMNFENMPELHTHNGYYYACLFTLIVTALMTIYLKRKKWF